MNISYIPYVTKYHNDFDIFKIIDEFEFDKTPYFLSYFYNVPNYLYFK